MVISRAIPQYRERDEPIGEEGAASPKRAYKEVLRPSQMLGLITTKSSFILGVLNPKNSIYYSTGFSIL